MIKIITTLLLLICGTLYAEVLSLSGTVISDNQKMITSRYMGFVKEVKVSEGDKVQKGDLLYVIDSKEIDSAIAQVELSISQAELSKQMYQNQHQNVLLNLQRHKRLLKKDMVSKYEVENLELAEKNLKAMVAISKKQVAQAKAKLQEVQNQYAYLNIKAPNSGVIVSKNIKVGEMAMPGMPAIVLSDLSDLKIETEVSESNLQSIALKDEVDIEIPSIGYTAVATVDAIIPNSNPLTHTFKIKLKPQKSHKRMYPGMYTVVTIK